MFKLLHQRHLVIAVSSIVLLVDFSDLLICCRNIDLLKKQKEIVRLRPFFQLNHARKSSSNVRITSNFFIRFRKYLLSKALPPACSRVVGVELHQAICSKMHSYVLFFGNAFISNSENPVDKSLDALVPFVQSRVSIPKFSKYFPDQIDLGPFQKFGALFGAL